MCKIQKDSWGSWLVCFGAFFTLAGAIGIDTSFGVVIRTIINQLDSTTMKVSWIQSTHSSTMFLFAFISSILMKSFGLRIIILSGAFICCASYIASAVFKNFIALFLSYGIIAGAGSGLLFTAANIACFHYFENYAAIASGIAMSGSCFGVFTVPLFCNFMNSKYGCDGYFVALSIISSFGFVFALFAFPLQIENQNDKEANKKVEEKSRLICTPKRQYLGCDENQNHSSGNNKPEGNLEIKTIKQIAMLLTDKRLFCYCLVHVFFELAYYVPIVFLPEMMTLQDSTISKEKAGSICSLLGLCCMVGKWMTALILQNSKTSPILLSVISMILLGTCCIMYPFCATYEHFVIITAFYGHFISPVGMLIPFITVELFGKDGLKDAYGLVMMTKAFFPIWGPPIAGALYDWSGTYHLAFYTAGLFQFLGGFFNFLVLLIHEKSIKE